MREIAVVLIDRANYGRLKPVIEAIDASDSLELQIVAGGSFVLRRFKRPVDDLEHQADAEVYCEIEGSTPATMARSVGVGVLGFVDAFERLDPDVVLIIGDRYEAYAAASAAAISNRCIVHVQGGELSGSIDERLRHAMTKLSHYHVPATQRAADRLVQMGEWPDSILTVGCPSSDLAAKITPGRTGDYRPLVILHPNTIHYDDAYIEMEQMIRAIEEVELKPCVLWPNIDAGSMRSSKEIRRLRQLHRLDDKGWQFVTHLMPRTFLQSLASTPVAIGNSSSFIRDGSFFGTPVVLVGDRQQGRETAENVLRVPPVCDEMRKAIRKQLAHGRYEPSTLYGDGKVTPRIIAGLENLEIRCDKGWSNAYVMRSAGPFGFQGLAKEEPCATPGAAPAGLDG